VSIKVTLSKRLPDTKKISKVVILNDRGEVLLLLRKKDQLFPENWDLPGGHLLVGETWEQGARRETKEETNLSLGEVEMIWDRGKNKYFRTRGWAGELFDKEDLPEHDDYIWADPNNLDGLKITKIYLNIIKRGIE